MMTWLQRICSALARWRWQSKWEYVSLSTINNYRFRKDHDR